MMVAGAGREFCDEMQSWLGCAVRAFLDAYLRDDRAAAAYLPSDALVEVSAGVVEWESR